MALDKNKIIIFACSKHSHDNQLKSLYNNNMKKLFLAAFAAFAMFATSSVSAQKRFTKPSITPELTTEADAALQAYKADPEKIKDAVKQMSKKKDNEALAAIGYYFLDKKEYALAQETANRLYSKDSKYIPGLVLAGDLASEQKKWGEAAQKYDEALNYDPEIVDLYLKKADVFKNGDPQTALQALSELKNFAPDLPETNLGLAQLYYKTADMKGAVESYKKYIEVVKNPSVAVMQEYAISLFADTNYVEALKVAESTLAKDPKNLALNRIRFYAEIEEKQYDKAFADKDKLFGQHNDTLYNYRDYTYLGRLESNMKMVKEAIEHLQKAVELKDKAKKSDISLYKDLSDAYAEAPDYDNAIKYYKIYADSTGAEFGAIDLLNLGKIYYQAASDEATAADKKTAYIQEGDKIFAQLSDRKKDLYYGPFWRARINLLVDPSSANDDAKTYYEEAIKRLGDGEGNVSFKKEANRYIAFYYMKKDNNDLSKQYCEKTLALDPNDKLANTILKLVSK